MSPPKPTDLQKPSKSYASIRPRKFNYKRILRQLRKSLDEELQSGSNGESYYRSVLMCHERGTSLCDNCKRVAAFLRSHARTSKHYYCTVPRCGEVKVHKVMDLTGLREEMQLMTITKDVKSVEAEARMS